MAPHSSTLAWKIPWTEEPGRLQSMGSLRVGHNWATSLSLFTFMHWRRKWQPTPVFLPGESQRQWAPVYGVTQSRTRLKRLSRSKFIFYTEVPQPQYYWQVILWWVTGGCLAHCRCLVASLVSPQERWVHGAGPVLISKNVSSLCQMSNSGGWGEGVGITPSWEPLIFSDT